MGISKAEAIANHRKMWNWIADETRKQKQKVCKKDYFKNLNILIKDVPLCCCYCCEYTIFQNKDTCDNCPINWGEKFDGKIKPCIKGLYGYWCKCYDLNWEFAAKLAEKIAELPEK